MNSPLDYCIQLHQKNRLPHALIFSHGEESVMEKAGLNLGKFLLCEEPKAKQACGTCHPCRLFLANAHPDFLHIQPEGKSQSIKIDEIRALSNFLHETALLNSYRVVFITQAENLNTAAANALLKSLEEPGDSTLLMLTTPDEHLLLPTLRSRAQLIHFEYKLETCPIPALLEYLNTHVQTAPNPELDFMGLAEKYHSKPSELLDTLYFFIQNSVIKRLKSSSTSSKNIQLRAYFEFLEFCLSRKKALSKKIALNTQLLAEEVLIKLYQLFNHSIN